MRVILLLLTLGAQPGVAVPAGAGVQQPPAGLEQVRAGLSISADTVMVGVPFVVQLRVRAPAGAAVEFPPGPDTSGVVQPLDPPELVAGNDSSAVDQTVRYRLAAWDVGAREVELGRVVVRLGNETRELAIGPVGVFVATVLPADSAEREPRPARPPFSFPRPWWIPWLMALAAAAIVGLLVWWYMRRRRRAEGLEPPLDPLAQAEQRFRHVDSLGLPEAGEPGLHVALMQEILREYMARRLPRAPESLTSRELMRALGDRPELPLDRLDPLLREGDLVKFAARSVTANHAREMGRESEALVRAIHDILATPEPDAATTESEPVGDGVGSAA